MQGKIKFINEHQGWGFITGDDSVDIFFHVNDFINKEEMKKLSPDDRVEYETVKTQKGGKAVKIKRVK